MKKVFDSFINKEIQQQLKNKNDFKKAVFLDRDGVIIKDRHYIKDPLQVELENNIKKIIEYAIKEGWLIIVITNQSGISKGLLSWEDYKNVNKRMLEIIGKPNPFAAIYANSLSKNIPPNDWRKPSPKMLFQAAKDFHIDLKKSIIIGDRISDIKAGANASLSIGIHLLTGHGKKERCKLDQNLDQNSRWIGKNFHIKVIKINTLDDFPLIILKNE